MKRSKEIVLVSHCILNSNSKVEGLSEYSGAICEIVNLIIGSGAGIIQLPCPEMLMYGIKRWGHVKEQFDTPYFREKCRGIIEPIIDQVIDYKRNGYKILGCIGIDGSPSCGVNKTCSGSCWGGELLGDDNILSKIQDVIYISESGVFIEEFKERLREKEINIPFIAIDEMNINSNIDQIKYFLTKGGNR